MKLVDSETPFESGTRENSISFKVVFVEVTSASVTLSHSSQLRKIVS